MKLAASMPHPLMRGPPPSSRAAATLRHPHRCPSLRPSTLQSTICTATREDELLSAETRWEQQVRDGKIENVSCAEAADELRQNAAVLLDVRPPSEVNKVSVPGAIAVPLFVVDDGKSPAALLKQMSAFGMGGWWLGGAHMKPNPSFLSTVTAKIPDRNVRLIVGCQKGLRSLAACEQLYLAGYRNLAWINGGFDTNRSGDLPTLNNRDMRYAGIGGLSEAIGWTEVQQQEGNEKRFSFRSVLGIATFLLVCDIALYGFQLIQYHNATGNWFPK